MSFTGWLQRRWNGVCDRTIGTEEFWRLAVDHQTAYDALKPMIQGHVRGVALDIGAGKLAWRSLIAASADRYVATDAFETHLDIAFVSDVQGNLPVADRTFDSAFCCSVLEHTQEPWKAFDEFYRILKPGGKMVLSVPFLYYLHGQPSDYYRFTRYGIENLARKSGFEIVELRVAGGLGHSALQALSILTTSMLFHPAFPHAARGACWLLTRMARLVDAADRGGLFAQSVNAVLNRPL